MESTFLLGLSNGLEQLVPNIVVQLPLESFKFCFLPGVLRSVKFGHVTQKLLHDRELLAW
jgi:hypothetical protein